MKNNLEIKDAIGIIITILLFLAINYYTPLITTKTDKIIINAKQSSKDKQELSATDKLINDICGKKYNVHNLDGLAIETFNDIQDSIYAAKDKIDDNGCYVPQFRLCNRKYDAGGYEIFTPVQQGCHYPSNSLNSFDTAFATVDKYLNTIPGVDNTSNTSANIRTECANSQAFKDGVQLFGLCNKTELENRYFGLQEQKAGLVSRNEGLDNEDIDRGIENTAHIYSACFNGAGIPTTTTQPVS